MSASSAEDSSMMSQPVKKARAPRLAPPRRNSRRVGSGISLAASFIRSWASRPVLRMRGMSDLLPSDDHGAQTFGHQECHDHVNDRKPDDGGHGEEMHVPRCVIAAEESRELLQLHRLPDREARNNHHDAGQD